MIHKNLTIYFNIFILVITITFSNIFSSFSYAETPVNAETTTEATTETPNVVNNFCEPSKQLNVAAVGAMLIDADTGISLYEKNADEVLYPASITKVMTTLLACEYGKFDEVVTHSHNAIYGIGYGSSTMGMEEGEQISFKDALYGIMMRSANETSMAVAEHISGTVDAFVEKMNEKAKELGCTNTHFANPHGFHDDNHYTTPRDMSKIVAAAVKNDDFAEIWGTELYTLPATNIYKEPRLLYNKSKILDDESQYYYQYAIGAKTGFHDQALNTLVCCAEKDGIKLISVVMKDMGYENAYNDTKTLFEYGFTQYEDKAIYSASSYESTEISVLQEYNGTQYPIGKISTSVKDDVSKKMPKFFNAEEVKAEAVLNENIEAPVEVGDVVGEVILTYNDISFGKVDIAASTAVDRLSDDEMAKMELIKNVKHYANIVLKHIYIVVGILILVILIIIIIRKIVKSIRKKRKKKRAALRRLKNDEIQIYRKNQNAATAKKTRTRQINADAQNRQRRASTDIQNRQRRTSTDAQNRQRRTSTDAQNRQRRTSTDIQNRQRRRKPNSEKRLNDNSSN